MKKIIFVAIMSVFLLAFLKPSFAADDDLSMYREALEEIHEKLWDIQKQKNADKNWKLRSGYLAVKENKLREQQRKYEKLISEAEEEESGTSQVNSKETEQSNTDDRFQYKKADESNNNATKNKSDVNIVHVKKQFEDNNWRWYGKDEEGTIYPIQSNGDDFVIPGAYTINIDSNERLTIMPTKETQTLMQDFTQEMLSKNNQQSHGSVDDDLNANNNNKEVQKDDSKEEYLKQTIPEGGVINTKGEFEYQHFSDDQNTQDKIQAIINTGKVHETNQAPPGFKFEPRK